MGTEAHDKITQKRTEATQAIVDSEADKKLIVAGPGTGKTFTFREALSVSDERGLALTFIRNLVAELRKDLSDVADVFTFHGFCKHQLYRHPTDGLQPGWHYYPLLLELIAYDLALIGSVRSQREIETALQTLDTSTGVINETLRLGSYYNAVSHTDAVCRVLLHFGDHEDEIPTFPLIVVDEYQDFNELKTVFIDLLTSRSRVLIAGDDDQALYSFKNAEARFIRELAEGDAYERFSLPYCSRCTDVVVSAVNNALKAAVANGNLEGRLEKDFQCFVPDKAADSAAHPTITHATCSTERKSAPYIGRYIVEQIRAISVEDIRESHERRYPTVLVAGPNPFLEAAFHTIVEELPQAQLGKSDPPRINVLDAYRYLAKDAGSRLGWRILLACEAFEKSDDALRRVVQEETELVELIPVDYRDRHLALARLVGRLLAGEELSQHEIDELVAVAGRSFDEILAFLLSAEANESSDEDGSESEKDAETEKGGPDERPSIICTSLTGSKGLSAGHVFIVGFNDGHLPRNPHDITDKEACEFVVGLSRTRKACHLVSVRHYGANWLKPSAFAGWIADHLEPLTVDKAYLEGR